MQLSAIQQQIVDSRNKNVLVSASAGSGKTSVLVERLCSLVIDDHIGLDSILAMTFTEDAAAEMKTRLKKKLQEKGEEDPYLAHQLSLLETASISTIHGFCLNLVQQYYYRLPVPYSMSRHVDNGLLDKDALDKAYQRALASLNPAEFAALKLYLRSFSRSEEDLREMILHFLEVASAQRDGEKWIDHSIVPMESDNYWFEQYFILRLKTLKEIFLELHEGISMQEFSKQKNQDDWLAVIDGKLEAVETCLDLLASHHYEEFRQEWPKYMSDTGKITPKIDKKDYGQLQKCSREMEKEISAYLYSLNDFHEMEESLQPLKRTFIQLARATRKFFQEEKQALEIIDFSDMEQFASRLLDHPDIRKEMQDKYQVILVDEYQDTNSLQESIISRISRENNVFRVGDIKQSIYGFRQARPQLMKELMEKEDDLHEVLYLNENYRSSGKIIDYVNGFFSNLMNLPALASQFSQQDHAITGLEWQKDPQAAPVRFLFSQYQGWMPEGQEKADDRQAKTVHRQNRIDWIARDIQKKVEQGVQLRDIAILSRTSTPHQQMRDALEAYGIRSIARSKSGFYVNQAIQIVMSVLRIIQNPHDDVALMAVLCSPIGKSTQAKVVRAAQGKEEGQSLYSALRNHPMLEFLDDLFALRSLPLGAMIEKIYAYNDFYYQSTSSQDKTNLDLLMQKAVEAQNTMDLQEFIERAKMEEDFNQTGEAMPFGREANAVKISTIHASKGLQYGVVYVISDDSGRDMDAGSPVTVDPDLGLSFAALSDNRHQKRRTISHIAFETKRFLEEQAERMRVLYVAATRAEKELVFVDSIKSLSDYEYPLSLRSLMDGKGYTGWILNDALNHPERNLVLDEVEEIIPRPASRTTFYRYAKPAQYSGPVQALSSKTASSAKRVLKWKPVTLEANGGLERGTFFHEMAEHLSFPYREKDAIAYAAKHNRLLSQTDLDQFLALNNQAEYQKWMKEKHVFECPYTAMIQGSLAHGFMDLVAFDEENKTIDILDFKTDHVFDMEALQERYHKQLETYRDAMKVIAPECKIRTWIYSFYLSECKELQDLAI